jgi:hypothetical protein
LTWPRATDCDNRPQRNFIAGGHEASGVRRAAHGSDVILCRVQREAVAIVHVLSGGMNIEALLFPDIRRVGNL